MSLRTRLLLGMVTVAIVLVVAAMVITRVTEQNLLEQVDKELADVRRPLADLRPGPSAGERAQHLLRLGPDRRRRGRHAPGADARATRIRPALSCRRRSSASTATAARSQWRAPARAGATARSFSASNGSKAPRPPAVSRSAVSWSSRFRSTTSTLQSTGSSPWRSSPRSQCSPCSVSSPTGSSASGYAR